MLCPYFVLSKGHSLCDSVQDGLMQPSIYEIERFCYREFYKCPYYEEKPRFVYPRPLAIREVNN